jgi:3-keto-5-aminohexanoate cleavage enzyme
VGWEDNTASAPEALEAIFLTLPDTCEKILVCNSDNASQIMGLAIAEGYHLQVGMKDAVYWPGGTTNPVPSTAYVVAKAIDVAGQLGRSIATPAEARTLLGVGD